MELNGQYIDYADVIYDLETCYGKVVGDGDYFVFWENCEDNKEIRKELENRKSEHRLIEKVLEVWKKLGHTQEERCENMWNMHSKKGLL